MTESEKKVEEYANEKEKIRERINNESYNYFHFSEGDIQQAYKDGYKQGQKDNDNYHLPAIEQKNEIINQLEKENEELSQMLEMVITDYVGQIRYFRLKETDPTLEEFREEERKKYREKLKNQIGVKQNDR